MNKNKTTASSNEKGEPTITRISAGLASFKKVSIKAGKWLRKEVLLVIGAILILILTLTLVTRATPVSRWIAAPSANCLAQGIGNTMVENNGIIYVLFSNASYTFKSFNPSTGDCSSTNLANLPVAPTSSTKLIKIDNNTLYATTNTKGFFYYIDNDYWVSHNRTKADDTVNSPPIRYNGDSQSYGNSIAVYNNEIYTLLGNSTTFLKYSPSTNGWAYMKPIPGDVGSGGALVYPGSGNYMYALRGNKTANFYQYDLVGDTWSTMSSTPGNVFAGGALTAIGGTDIYAFQGNNSRQFWKYNIAGNSWTNLPDQAAPDRIEAGAALTTIGAKIYALQGNLQNKFWELDTSVPTPTWVEKANFPENVFSGGSLTTDGTNIYATKGKALGNFYKYDPISDLWTMLKASNTGIGSNPLPGQLTYPRGGIAYVPIGPSSTPEIYMSTGSGSNLRESIARYIISSNTWPAYLTSPNYPSAIGYGGVTIYPDNSDNLFVLAGNNTNLFWKFLLSRNLFLTVPISKFDSIKEIMAYIPGFTPESQGQGSSVTKANDNLYHLLGGSTTSITKFVEYSPYSNFWTQLPSAPKSMSVGGAITSYDDNTLFASSGANFWKYDIPNKTWFNKVIGKAPNGQPIAQTMGDNETYNSYLTLVRGSHMVEKDGELYIFRGELNKNLYNYSPTNNRWIELISDNNPNISSYANSVIAGDYIFTLIGGNYNAFRRYDIPNNTWTSMSDAPLTPYYGATSTYPGGDFIYTLPGTTEATRGFMRYCIANTSSGCTANTWTNLSATMPPPHVIKTGGSMTAYDSATLYAIAGNNTTNFMRFDITNSPTAGDGVWTDLSTIDPLPGMVASGGSLTTDGTYLYATRGNLSKDFWRYDPAGTVGSRWTVLPQAPFNIGFVANSYVESYGNIVYSPTLGDIYAMPGHSKGGFYEDTYYDNLLFRYQLPASSADPVDDNSWPVFLPTANPPGPFFSGTALTHPNNSDYIYALRGGFGSRDFFKDFWRYNVPNNQWETFYQSKLDDDTPVSQGDVSLSQTYGNTIAEVDGEFYVINGYTSSNFNKYNPTTNTWTPLTSTPSSCSNGTSIVKIDSNNLYIFSGDYTNNFWHYNIPSDSWNIFNIATLPNGAFISQKGATQGYGASIVKVNNPVTGNPVFYITSGGYYGTTFEKYDPSTNAWTPMSGLPRTANNYGLSLLAVGTDIYYSLNQTNYFYKYDTIDNSWTTLTSSGNNKRAGTNLAYPGSGDYIYMLYGYDLTTNNFGRYSISGNSWTYLANTPGNVDAGGSIAFLNSNDLYALRGNNFRDFWKYDLSANTWDTMSSDQPPFVATVQSGGSLVSDGTYLYATPGNNTKEYWRYDPSAASGNRWMRFSSTIVGNTGDIPAFMGVSHNTNQKGNTVFCEDCGGAGLDEIWAVTGNGITGYQNNANAGLIFRFRIDPVTCDAIGENPGTGSDTCNGYNGWIYSPKAAVAPSTVYAGGSLTYPGSGDLIYAFGGDESTAFWAYNIATNVWSTLTNAAPATVFSGGSLTSYINETTNRPDIYALRGSDTNSFWLYRVSDATTGAGDWTIFDPADKPGTVASSGASLTAIDDSGNIYASSGRATGEIYRYQIDIDTWSSVSPLYGDSLTFPSQLYIGYNDPLNTNRDDRGGLAYTASGPSGGPELFAITGNGSGGSGFTSPENLSAGLIYRYPLTTGPNVGTWPLSYTPPRQTGSGTLPGCALVSTDSNSIFAIVGGHSKGFWRYDIGNDTWNLNLPETPMTIGNGGALTENGNNTIFATSGDGTSDASFFKYTINDSLSGSGSWSSLTNSPVAISGSSGGAAGGLAYTDLNPGFTGDENVWMFTGHGSPTSSTGQLLYRYDVDANAWPYYAPASNPTTNTRFSAGSDLTLNADETTIYALRGTETSYAYGSTYWSSSNPNFWKYNIASDIWTPLNNVFGNIMPKRIYSGGSIVSIDIDNDVLFASTGNSTKDILKYSILGDSWLAPSNLAFPFSVGTQTNSSDGGGLIYSPSTQKLLGTTGTDTTSPYTIYYADLANRVVPTLSSSLATTDTTFNILVTATELNDLPLNVTQNTTITLSLKSGTGSLGGTLTGVIANEPSTMISNLTYNAVEDIIITATDTSVSPTLLPFDAAFTVYGPSPTITQISPNSGATTGGTTVTITGTGFTEGTYVTFDNVESDEFTFVSSTELQVVTPGLIIGTIPYAVNVSVVKPSTQSGTSTNGYTYLAPTISSITPSSGATAGGTPVTISGDNFGPNFYFKGININNTSGPVLTDYPVKITTNTAILISDGQMRPDCGDLRIRDNDAHRQLNYWIEDNTCNTSATNIWVKVPNIPSGNKTIELTYGNKLLTSHSDGNKVFLFFDDFEQNTLDTSKWTETKGTPRVFDGKLILNNEQGIYAGDYLIPSSTIWETLANPITTSSRYGNALKGSKTAYLAWETGSTIDIVSMLWSSSNLYAETLAGDTSMGTYAIGFKPYKITYLPNNNNQVLFNYNSGTTTTVNNADSGDTLHPSFYLSSGNFDAQWEYVFIRPYGAATEPIISPTMEVEGIVPLTVQFDSGTNLYNAEDIEFINNETVKAITPTAVNGLHDTIVTNADGRSATLANSFTYLAPTITSVSPNTGTTEGGTNITISGTNFSEGGYRKAVFIANKTATTLTDQTLFFTLNTSGPVSEEQMQDNCRDVRIKDSDHLTQLDYWVEACGSPVTRIWVKIPSIPPAGKNIYVHYGNPNYYSPSITNFLFPTLGDPTPVLWMKSDYGIDKSGNAIYSWQDASGNGNDLRQDTASSRPLDTIVSQNGIPGVSFDGSNDFMSRTGTFNLPTGNADRSIFSVVRYDKGGFGGFIYGNSAANEIFGIVIAANNNLGIIGWVNDYITSSSAIYQGILLQEAVLNGINLKQWRNGLEILNTASTTFNTSNAKIEVGRGFNGPAYIDMDLFEVMLFDKALSTTERQEVENYLTLKYNLNDNVQTSTYTNGTFEENIVPTFSTLIVGTPDTSFTSFSYVDSKHISAVTPPHAAGTESVKVVMPNLQSVTALNSFTFVAPPTITSISPITGTNDQDALSVDVIGANITINTKISLSQSGETDIICVNYSNITSTALTCELDIDHAKKGVWDVNIYRPDVVPGTGSTLTNGFDVTAAPPIISGFTPSGGTTLGGTAVTIAGDYFVVNSDGYQSPITISNTGTEQNDFQVQFTMDTAALITAGKMNANCSDIRVYSDEDLGNSIPYYLESGCNTSSTVFWTQVPTIAENTTTTIYANYGVPARISESSGDDVFLFFDDFEADSINLDKWIPNLGSTPWGIENTSPYQGTYDARNSTYYYRYNVDKLISRDNLGLINIPTGKSAIIDFYWKINSYSNYGFLYYCSSNNDTSTSPTCTYNSGFANRITGDIPAWTREMSTTQQLGPGLHRILFGYYHGYTGGTNTGQIDAVKVRLYSTSISNGIVGTEVALLRLPVVTFDTTEASSITYLNSTTLIAISPSHSAGAIDITITNEDLQSAVSPVKYLYSSPPSIASISPNSGSTSNNALTVTISGSNFLDTPTAKLTKAGRSDINCGTPYNFIDATTDSFQCDFDLTGVKNGNWNVVVINPDQQTVTLPDGFAITYAPPTITSITPTSGPSQGGTSVTITGTGFSTTDNVPIVQYPLNYTGSSPLTNYQIQLSLDTEFLASDSMRSDCHDIRLFDEDKTTPIDYYIQNLSDCGTSTPLSIWAKVPSISNPGKSINLQYGNPLWTTDNSSTTNTFESVIPNSIAEWSMDDLSGSTVTDSSSNQNHGTAIGTTIVDGLFGKARSFQGSPDYINYGVKASLNPSGITAEHAMEAWVKLETIQDDYPTLFNLWEENGTYDKSYLLDFPGQSVRYYTRNAANSDERRVQTSNLGLYDNQWHHIVATHKYSSGYSYFTLYVDGVNKTSSSSYNYGMRSTLPTINLQMGKQTYAGFQGLRGLIDSARIYDRALTQTEVTSLFNNYGFLESSTGSVLVSKIAASPPTVEAPIKEPAFITFGGARASNVVALNSTTITAKTPAGTGLVDVEIINPDTQSDTLADAYTYIDPPTIISISPNTGNNEESLTGVIITGTDFVATPTVTLYLEETPLSCENVTYVDSEHLTCNLDLDGVTVGKYIVQVQNPDLEVGALIDGFTVTSGPPTITNVSPNSGPGQGGTTVTITGTNFYGNSEPKGYFVPITISNTGTEQSDYQVQVTLNTASLISAGKMNANCSDIRFYSDENLENNLPYYLESGCNTSSTVLWAKVPTITENTTTTIYANYGAPERTSESSGDNVFLFFDDFEEGSINSNKWEVGGNVNWIIEASDRFEGIYSSKSGTSPGNYGSSYIVSKAGSSLINIPTGSVGIIDFYWKVSSEGGWDFLFYCESASDTTLPPCVRASADRIAYISGTSNWSRELSSTHSKTLAPGNHRLKFAYEKDGSGNSGSDTGWIDAVKVRLYSANIGDGVVGTEGLAIKKLAVEFDGVRATNVTYISPTSLTAITPVGSGLVDVTIINPDTQSDTLTDAYTYIAPPTIISISPNTGNNEESLTGVIITGTDFVATPTVTLYIGETPLSCTNVTYIDSEHLTCDLNLNGASRGDYMVLVRNPDSQTDYLTDGFEVTYPQPTITDISPNQGNIAGGEIITITGTYFEDGATVTFNGVYSPDVTYVGATELTVETPSHTFGFKNVTITNPTGMTVTANNGYEYLDPPIITDITPATGASDLTNLEVVISGTNFVLPPTAKITKTGETSITCTSVYQIIDDDPDYSFHCFLNIQDAAVGLWNLVVTNGNGQVGTLEDAFEVTFGSPRVIAVVNNTVAFGSTQQVTVGGSNFYSEAPDLITVDIGGSAGVGGTPCTSPTIINTNSLTCNLPALSAGSYNITVTTGLGTYTAPNLITYLSSPTVTQVTPDHGPTSGGKNITITGTNFFGTPTVFMTHSPIEETTATNVTVVNPTTLTCTTPVSIEGLVDIKVVTQAGNDTLEAGYLYEAPPADANASTIEIFGQRIEPISSTYYDQDNLSPVNAAFVKVTALEDSRGNLIVGRNVTLTATPADDLLIHTTNCNNMRDSAVGATATTDIYGTACFLVWSTAEPSFFSSTTTLNAAIAGSGTQEDTIVADTVTLEIEQMALTSILNFRFRNDDGTELTATPIGETSVPYYNAENDLAFRLRFGLTRNMPLSSSFDKNDEFSPTANVAIGPRPLPAASPEGLSSFRAFPAYAIDNSTDTLYIATPNRADSKARIYKYYLNNLTQTATYFEFPGTVNFEPDDVDDIDSPIDGSKDLITKMFIDEDNHLMYFVLTSYGLPTKVYKVNLVTETVVDVFSDPLYQMHRGSLDAEIDLSNNFLYVTLGAPLRPTDVLQIPVSLLKLDLNGPTEAITAVGELLLANDSSIITSSVIDLTNQFLYLTTGYPQKIVKIDLNVDDLFSPVKVDEIALVPIPAESLYETNGIQNAIIDPVAGYAYFASSTNTFDPEYQDGQKVFLTKVDIDPTREFEVVSRLNLTPPNPDSDYDYHADYAHISTALAQSSRYPFASIDQINGYGFFLFARQNTFRNQANWKLMRIHLDTFTRESLYDEMMYADELDSDTIKGSIFRPETGRGYIIRETIDGDTLTEFNSTTRQNLKLQSSPNVNPHYCNLDSADLYTWSDLPNSDFVLADSANFTDSAPTTNVTGLLYDNNDYFTPGQLKDSSATTDRISMGQNQFTEIEYSLKPTTTAKGSYCFRLVDADPDHQNQVSGNPNLIHNIITSDFEVANFHHFVPLTINGVILEKNEVLVVEGTTTDSYGIKLATAPTDDVTITVTTGDSRLILSPDATPLTPNETTITFTTADWDTYQYIEVSTEDNQTVNGTVTDLIHHTVVSDDLGYDNIIVEPVTSIVTDYGATISNVLATVSGTITFTPPSDFLFPDVDVYANTPNYSPSLTIKVNEGRGMASDYTLTLQANAFCREVGVCIPLADVYTATSNLINSFSTFTPADIGLFLANYLQTGEDLNDPDTYKHTNTNLDRPLSSPITLIDTRNVPSGNTDNPLQGLLNFDLNLMIDYANITGLTSGLYSTLLTIDLNANPL